MISTLDSWGENYIPKGNAQMESYDGYVIVKAWAGVEGYDLRVDYDSSYAVTGLACLLNGEEYTSGTSGGVYLYTGLDVYYCFYAYVESGYGYCYDMGEGNSSYLVLSGYFYDADNNSLGAYYFEWPAETYVAPLPTVDNLNALVDFENGAEFTMNVDLTVIYANGSYVYVTDGISNALIYKSGLGLEAGNIIAAGWDAKLSIYKNLPEIIPSVDLTVSGDAEELPTAIPVETADVATFVAANNLCAYLNLQGIEFTEVTPESGEFKGLAGETEVTFYNTFKLESQVAGIYNVTGFVSIYNETVQFQPVAYELVKETPILQFTAQGAVINNNQGWSYLNMVTPCNVAVECYSANTIIIPTIAGVEGYGMKVEFDTNNYITGITPIENGVEGTTVTSGYCGIYTGLDDYYYFYAYVGTGYGYAYNSESGYVMQCGYFYDADGSSTYGAYYVEWPAPTVVDNLNAIGDFPNDEQFIMGAPLTVLYANGNYAFATDGVTNTLLYAEELGLAAGNVIKTGWKGANGEVDGVEVILPAQSLSASSTVEVPAATEVETADAASMIAAYNRNAYLCLQDITFAEATPEEGEFTGLAGAEKIPMLNFFGLPSMKADTYDVIGFVWVDGETVTFVPVSIEYRYLGTSTGAVINNNQGWSYLNMVTPCNIQVKRYGHFLILPTIAGVEGYGMKIEFDENNYITAITPIEDGVEGTTVTSGYCGIYTGLDDYYYFYAYVGTGYGYAYNTESGYAMQCGYFYDADGNSTYGAYYVEWPAPTVVDNLNAIIDFAEGEEFIVGAPLTVLYANGAYNYVTDGTVNALVYAEDLGLAAGDVLKTGWKAAIGDLDGGQVIVPAQSLTAQSTVDVPAATPVEPADASMMIAAYNRNAYLCLQSIAFAETTPVEGLFTGMAGENEILFNNIFAVDSVAAGNYDVTGFVAADSTQVVFLPISIAPHMNYEAQGFVTTYTSWGKNRIPKTNAQVESYDGFIIIRAWAGVEGFDVKMAYDADGYITGITPIVDGVEGEETTSGYVYCYTGLEDYYCFSAYVGRGYGYLYDQGEGNESYALQSGYFYRSDSDDYKYGAYYIEWPAEDYVAPDTVDNLNALTDFEAGAEFIYGAQLTVIYSNEENQIQYVTDGVTNAMMVTEDTFEAGTVISASWEGVVADLFYQPTIVPTEELETEAELAEVPDATPVEAADAEMMVALYNINAYLCIEKVVIAENIATKGEFTATVGEGSIILDNRFVMDIEANRYYVTGFVGSNGTSAVFVPVAVVADPSTGIDGIGLDGNNEEIYYNLQGIRVQKPAAGKVYIRVANGKAERIVK